MGLIAMAATLGGPAIAQGARTLMTPTPQVPKLPTPPPSPVAAEQKAESDAQTAKRKALMQIAENSGRGSTILTGDKLGLLSMPQMGGKTLTGV